MANKQINELPSGGALQDTDLMVLQRAGAAYNVLGSQIAKQSDMDTAESDIDTLQSDLATAEGRLDTAEDDIDTLQSQMTTAQDEIAKFRPWVSANSFDSTKQLTINFTGTGRFMLFISSSSSAREAVFMVYGTVTGTPFVVEIYKGSSISYTTETGKLIISNSSATTVYPFIMAFNNNTYNAINPVVE